MRNPQAGKYAAKPGPEMTVTLIRGTSLAQHPFKKGGADGCRQE
jgi:hypothetical protein